MLPSPFFTRSVHLSAKEILMNFYVSQCDDLEEAVMGKNRASFSKLNLWLNGKLDSADEIRLNRGSASHSDSSSLTNKEEIYDKIISPIESEASSLHSSSTAPESVRRDFRPRSMSIEWNGYFPPKFHLCPVYSRKVFLGGIPFGITEDELKNELNISCQATVEWSKTPGRGGHVYLILESDAAVKSLLASCSHDRDMWSWHKTVSTTRRGERKVEIIPWLITENNHVGPHLRHSPKYHTTVFVGGLHGKITARDLTQVMRELFGTVVFTGIDTDPYKYPIGSARVTFMDRYSYKQAIKAAFVTISTPDFTKSVQIDPYQVKAVCYVCQIRGGPMFCRDHVCLRYFCEDCWIQRHSRHVLAHHTPMFLNKN